MLIFNVRMGLKCVYKVIHGTTLWDPFLKCGTVLWDRDQERTPYRIYRPSYSDFKPILGLALVIITPSTGEIHKQTVYNLLPNFFVVLLISELQHSMVVIYP